MSDQLVKLQDALKRGEVINDRLYCNLMLEKVSRTFALTIKALGAPFKEPILLGYLFCRIADTFEDSEKLPLDKKCTLLDLFGSLFDDTFDTLNLETMKSIVDLCKDEFDLNDFEEFLCLYQGPVFNRHFKLQKPVRSIIGKTVLEMVNGMKETLIIQENCGTVGTSDETELERYCYYVAGTVGNMLTALFQYYSPWINTERKKQLDEYNIAFGEGLQLTNIIKDAMTDLKRGVSFIPKDLATKYNVSLDKLYLPQFRDKAQKVMNYLITKAVKNLNKAMKYSLLIPKLEPRVRLFCLMPLFLAIKTLEHSVNNEDLLIPDRKVKITRAEVKQMIRTISINCFWDYKLVKEYEKMLCKIEEQLGVKIPLGLPSMKYLPVTPT